AVHQFLVKACDSGIVFSLRRRAKHRLKSMPPNPARNPHSQIRNRYCHLKIFNATTKLITSHASNITTWIQLVHSGAPSFITVRRSVLSAVSGNALMNGWKTCGKRSDEKKVPESNHIGSMIKFIKPDTPSIVVGRAATSRPIPEKVKPPSKVISETLSQEPRTVKPKTSLAKTTTAATSSSKNTSRESM